MSTLNDLGFKSALVLVKLGHDLGGRLEDTIEAPIPEHIEAKAAQIADLGADRNEIVLGPDEYRTIDDGPLF